MPEQSTELYATAVELIPVLLILVVLETRLAPRAPEDRMYRPMTWLYAGTIAVGCLALLASVVALVVEPRPEYRATVEVGLPMVTGLAVGVLLGRVVGQLRVSSNGSRADT